MTHQSWKESQQRILLDCFTGLNENEDVCSHILSFLVPDSLCSMRLVSTQFDKIIKNYHLLDSYAGQILEKIEESIREGRLASLVWILTLYPHLNNTLNEVTLRHLTQFDDLPTQSLGFNRAIAVEQVSDIVKHILCQSDQPTQQLTDLRLARRDLTFVESILNWIMEDPLMRDRVNWQVFLEEASYELNMPVVKLLIDKRWADPTQNHYECFNLKVDDELWSCLLTHPSVDKTYENNSLFKTAYHSGLTKTVSELLLDQRVRDLITDYEDRVLHAINTSNVSLLDILLNSFPLDSHKTRIYLSKAMHLRNSEVKRYILNREDSFERTSDE